MPTKADTSSAPRIEHGKTEHSPAQQKRKALKPRSSAPSTQRNPDARQYGPDQPWETEFLVDNDLMAHRQPEVVLAAIVRYR